MGAARGARDKYEVCVRPKFMLSLSPHTSVRQSKGTYIEAQGPDLFALHFWSQPNRLSGGKSIITFQFFLAWSNQLNSGVKFFVSKSCP